MPSPEFCSSVRYGRKRVQRNKQLIIGEKPFPAYSGWEVLQSNPKCQIIDGMLAQYQSDPAYLRTHSFSLVFYLARILLDLRFIYYTFACT